jgi:hypothetical protein
MGKMTHTDILRSEIAMRVKQEAVACIQAAWILQEGRTKEAAEVVEAAANLLRELAERAKKL